MLAVPVFPRNAYRNALQRSRCNECDDIHDADYDGYVDDASESLVREDAEIEEQNCYLGQCDGRKVEKLSVVEDLSSKIR